jgi:hypothetical protein
MLFGAAWSQASMIATARGRPANARSILSEKFDPANPLDGYHARLCSVSIWQ